MNKKYYAPTIGLDGVMVKNEKNQITNEKVTETHAKETQIRNTEHKLRLKIERHAKAERRVY